MMKSGVTVGCFGRFPDPQAREFLETVHRGQARARSGVAPAHAPDPPTGRHRARGRPAAGGEPDPRRLGLPLQDPGGRAPPDHRYLLPGDLCDHGVPILREMDHSIGSLTAVTLAEIPPETVRQLTADHARLAQALTWESWWRRRSSGNGRSISASAPPSSASATCSASSTCACRRSDSPGHDLRGCPDPGRDRRHDRALGGPREPHLAGIAQHRADRAARPRTHASTAGGATAGGAVQSQLPHLDHEGRHLDANET